MDEGVQRYKGVATIVQLRLAANWIAMKMLQRTPENVAQQQQIQEVLKAERGRGEKGVRSTQVGAAHCVRALHFCQPKCVQQISYISLRLPVSPPLTGKCAQLQGSHDLHDLLLLLLGCKRQRKSWSTLRLVRALHLICILGLLTRCRGQATGDRNSLTWRGWVPALPEGSSNEGALVASGKATLSPPFPLPLRNSLSHFLYASTVC